MISFLENANENGTWKDWDITVTSKHLKANPFFFFLLQAEQIIYDHFSDPKFIEQLIKFLSLEDRKGKDKFNPRRFCLFKVRGVQSLDCSHFVTIPRAWKSHRLLGSYCCKMLIFKAALGNPINPLF